MIRWCAAIACSRSSRTWKNPLKAPPKRVLNSRLKTHPKIIDRIIEGIRESRTICVAGHIRPDGDCVGSQLGLTLALQNEGKKVVCWNEDTSPQKYGFLDPAGLMQKPKRGLTFDCVIATDAASFERLGAVGPCISQRKLF